MAAMRTTWRFGEDKSRTVGSAMLGARRRIAQIVAIYIVTLAVIALFLLLGYRSFGGQPSSDAEVTEFVGKLINWIRSDAARLEFLCGDDPVTEQHEDIARSVRKKLTGYQQQLDRLTESEDELDDIGLAIEPLTWACRMVESGACQLSHTVDVAARQLFRDADVMLKKDLLTRE